MAEEKYVVPEEPEQNESGGKKKKWPIVLGVVLVVVVILGIAGWTWHEEPSFCNAFCHSPMDRYVEDYYAADKPGMLISSHAKYEDCLGCHVPTIQQMAAEGISYVKGSFTDPLPKRNLGNDFCFDCHGEYGLSSNYADLEQDTADLPFNPHATVHGEQECASCHRVHDVSVMSCVNCHADAAEAMPEGWITPQEAQQQGLDVVSGM